MGTKERSVEWLDNISEFSGAVSMLSSRRKVWQLQQIEQDGSMELGLRIQMHGHLLCPICAFKKQAL